MVMTRAKNWRGEELEKATIELSALAKHFELYNRTEGKSPKTIDWHNLALRQFHRRQFLTKYLNVVTRSLLSCSAPVEGQT